MIHILFAKITFLLFSLSNVNSNFWTIFIYVNYGATPTRFVPWYHGELRLATHTNFIFGITVNNALTHQNSSLVLRQLSHAHQNFLWDYNELCSPRSPDSLVLQRITQNHAHQIFLWDYGELRSVWYYSHSHQLWYYGELCTPGFTFYYFVKFSSYSYGIIMIVLKNNFSCCVTYPFISYHNSWIL